MQNKNKQTNKQTNKQLPYAGGKDTCKGDSGGPMTCPRRNMHVVTKTRSPDDHVTAHVLAGVTSWGRSCGEEGTLPVFTRVGSFRKWIDEVMGSPPTVVEDPCRFRGVVHRDRKSDIITSPAYLHDVTKGYPPNMDCVWRYDVSWFGKFYSFTSTVNRPLYFLYS